MKQVTTICDRCGAEDDCAVVRVPIDRSPRQIAEQTEDDLIHVMAYDLCIICLAKMVQVHTSKMQYEDGAKMVSNWPFQRKLKEGKNS